MRRIMCIVTVLSILLLAGCQHPGKLLTASPSSSDQAAGTVEKQSDRKERLYDDARLLTDVQRTTISTLLDYMSDKRRIDIAIAVIDTTGGADVLNYAHFLYSRRGFGYGGTDDGILLLLAHKDHSAAISTSGRCTNLYSKEVTEHILREITPLMTEEDFAGAFNRFITLTDELYSNKVSAELIK